MKVQMGKLMTKVSEQQLALNKICKHNGFLNKKSKEQYALYEMGQTFAVQSFTTLNRSELNHLDDIAALFVDNNQDNQAIELRTTAFFGGKSEHAILSFPEQSVIETSKRSDYKNFWVRRLEWSVGTYIESLRFAMADGAVSPRLGGRPFTHGCDLSSPIKMIETTYRERGLVSLKFITETEEVLIQGSGEGKHSDKVKFIEGVEKFLQVKVRLANNLITGISFGILSN